MRLTPELLVKAYANGFFPMGEPENDEIHWYRPDPRAIVPLENFHSSTSLLRTIRKKIFDVTFDTCFDKILRACADRKETWITGHLIEGYGELHKKRIAHSVEVWKDGELAGGLYGVSLGGAFFAESKFHVVTNASKVALYHLVERLKERKFELLEVQFLTPHLEQFGAVEIPDAEYQERLARALTIKTTF